jgi:DNA repair exonuclease SbcCD nuclease subunit
LTPLRHTAGNHDEPAGADNLSAIDILAACNLVNYYGKTARTPHARTRFLLQRRGP